MDPILIIILNNIILIGLIVAIVISMFYMRNKLYALWHEVSRLELIFNKNLMDTLDVYLKNSDILSDFPIFQTLTKFTPKEHRKFRCLQLQERQILFKKLQRIYAEFYKSDDDKYKLVKKQFETLQQSRLKYNSKVLLYNQKIHTFPTKIFAKRMNFLPKEYFG